MAQKNRGNSGDEGGEGRAMATRDSQDSASLVPIPKGQQGMGTGNAPLQFLANDISSRGTKMRPRIVALKQPGDYIDGRLVGEGSGVDIENIDKVTGEVRVSNVKTWNFDCSVTGDQSVVLGLMGNYQVDRELPELVGKRVRVTMLGILDTRAGRRVKDCMIEYYDAEAEIVEMVQNKPSGAA